jgi:nucleotide-binding universal stress UspA family protein
MGAMSHRIAYLTLKELAADPALARRLPPDVAWRCHALPVAEDRGRITVAMAHPDDDAARDAVLTALGPGACVVQADPSTIDSLLSEIWGGQPAITLDPAVCSSPESIADAVREYSQALANLLGAHVSCVSTMADMESLLSREQAAQCNLIVLPEGHDPPFRQLLSRLAADDPSAAHLRKVPTALLVAQEPRWPLTRILLVLWGEEADQAAVDWVVRLAQPSGSAVIVLVVVPPVPAMYSGMARMQQALPELLTTNTVLGRQLRQAARNLAECQVESTLRLRQGSPDWQVGRELMEREYDLIALATRPRRRWLHWLREEPVSLLLRKTDRPVLMAIPTIA